MHLSQEFRGKIFKCRSRNKKTIEKIQKIENKYIIGTVSKAKSWFFKVFFFLTDKLPLRKEKSTNNKHQK